MSEEETIVSPAADSEVDEELREPKKFKVILLNDDYTTMEFVVDILEKVFNKSPSEATKIMLKVHNEGQAVCGIYPKEIAEAKVETVHRLARKEGFPLMCTMEEAE
ncbi:MAG: ATP-dependent Clp protease adapter ClpS [Candidatus Dadabacteria bacterium]|nr:MAG: ATP-dependent Clp protease adapter ClpS [Candidatus Dadabacteria bacterium]